VAVFKLSGVKGQGQPIRDENKKWANKRCTYLVWCQFI